MPTKIRTHEYPADFKPKRCNSLSRVESLGVLSQTNSVLA